LPHAVNLLFPPQIRRLTLQWAQTHNAGQSTISLTTFEKSPFLYKIAFTGFRVWDLNIWRTIIQATTAYPSIKRERKKEESPTNVGRINKYPL
jgi:hypothetical protein